MESESINKPQRDLIQELEELLLLVEHPIQQSPKPLTTDPKKEFTYYTDNRRTILTSGTFAI